MVQDADVEQHAAHACQPRQHPCGPCKRQEPGTRKSPTIPNAAGEHAATFKYSSV